MPLVTLKEIEKRGKARYAKNLMTKSAGTILREATTARALSYEFDVFLSHSYSDAKLNMDRLLGVKAFLEEFNVTVYVDWIIDTNLNRETVSDETARILRTRMNHSKCILFATSERSQISKWMPWELGYMDGRKQKVAIFPLVATAGRYTYNGQEYLGLYPYIEQAAATNSNNLYLWVCEDDETYVRLDLWLKGQKPHKH